MASVISAPAVLPDRTDVRHHDFIKPHGGGPKKRQTRASVPVQVYLATGDLERLERLAHTLVATKSDVPRRGLAALKALQQRAAGQPAAAETPLPVFGGRGLRAGVDLDNEAARLDVMEQEPHLRRLARRARD